MKLHHLNPHHKKNLLAAALVLFAAGAVIIALTSKDSSNEGNSTRDHVTATVFPIYDIARTVAGDAVRVDLMLPPGAEPHTFEPAPSDALNIRGSSVIFAVGHGLDNWANRLGESVGTPIVTIDHNIDLLPASEDHEKDGSSTNSDDYDPHYWLNANNAIIIAENIADYLTILYPESSDQFTTNLITYRSDLLKTDADIRASLNNVRNRNIATFHGAFHYFADAYNLNVAAEFEEFPGRVPSARYLSDLIDTLKKSGTSTIYGEPNFNTDAISIFAKDNNLRLATLDPLGGTSERNTLIKTLLFNANEIASNQK